MDSISLEKINIYYWKSLIEGLSQELMSNEDSYDCMNSK